MYHLRYLLSDFFGFFDLSSGIFHKYFTIFLCIYTEVLKLLIVDVKWQWYSSQTAITANQAVDRFWASRSEYERNLNSMTATPNVNLTVNFNEPIDSPVQVARKMEEVTNNLVKQLKK